MSSLVRRLQALRFAPLLGTAALGCTSLLGLENMSYDQEPVDGSGSAPSGMAGSPGREDLVVFPTDSPVAVEDFPATWSVDALLAAEPLPRPNSRYWVYEPSTGTLNSFRSQQGIDDATGSAEAEKNWTHLTTVPLGVSEDPVSLIGYRSDLGLVDFAEAPEGDTWPSIMSKAGNPGWSHVVSLPTGNLPRLFSYNTQTGSYKLSPADPALSDPPAVQGTLLLGLDAITPATIEGRSGLLASDFEDGSLSFYPITDGALGVAEVQAGIGTGWSHLLLTSDAHLLLYSAETGSACVSEFASEVPEPECVYWRQDLDQIILLFVDNEEVAVTYSSQTGVADARHLFPLEQSAIVK